jgi:hypothetical protein
MNRSFLFVIAAFALSVAPGCKTSNTPSGGSGDPTDRTPLTQDDGPASAKGPDVLVFVPGPAAKPGKQKPAGQTIWYTISGDALEEVARAPGRVFASKDGAMWKVDSRVIPSRMQPCSRDEGDAPIEVNHTVPTIAPLGGEAKDIYSPFEPGADPNEEEYFEFSVHRIQQLSEYVFVHGGAYYECGAHPSYAPYAWVVSLADGSWVEQGEFMEAHATGMDDERKAAYAKMDREVVHSEESKLWPTSFSVEMVEGEPKMSVQMTAETAYVVNDGSWGSYSMSQTVEVNGVPAALAPAVEPPAPLLAMFVKEGAYFEHSVFMAPAAKRAELLAAFEALK